MERVVIMLPVLIGVALTFAALYWVYKKLRGPVYVPGSVAKLALKHPKLFDDASSQGGTEKINNNDSDSSTSCYWMMSDTLRLFYFSVRNTEPSKQPILLGIHGGPSIAPYKPWSLPPSLGTFYLYHARGCGQSTRPFREWPTPGRMWPGIQILERELGIGAQLQDVERIRRQVTQSSSDSTIVLIGHSFGGFIATLYAAEFPDHVKALVLLAPAGVLQLPPPKGTPDLFQTIRNKLQELGNTAHLAEFETFYNRYFDFGSLPNATEKSLARLHAEFALHFERASGDDFSQEEMDAMVDDDKIGGLACFATYLSMGFQHNYKPQLQKVFRDTKFPVLIVHGNQDLVPVSSSKEYQELFPSATLQVLDGANHFLHDDPRVSECIQDILSQV